MENSTPPTTPTPQVSPEEQAHNDKIAEHFDKGDGTEGGLPQQEEAPKPDMFNGMSDEWKEQNLKDGKLFGKFDSIEAMAKSYQKINDERAERGTQEKASQEELTKEELKASVSNEQLQEIANNDFNLTPENYQAFKDAGVSEMEAQNMAFKMEKAANQAYDLAGGKTEYNELMVWAGENLSEQEVAMYSQKVVGDNFSLKDTSSMAVEWLQMKRAQAPSVPTQVKQRVNGNTPQRQEAGFTSKRDYNDAMNYLRKNPRDTSAQRDYDHKMSLTNMNNLR